MGIFSGLSKKKTIEPVILSVEVLISEVLKKNLENKISSTLSPVIEVMKLENFQLTFVQDPGGYVLRYFSDSLVAPLAIYVPEDFLLKYISPKNRKVPEPELVNIFGTIPGYLLSEIDKSVDCTGSYLNSRNELLWSISAYKVIKVKINSVSVFLFMDEKRFILFNKNCLESEITFNNIDQSLLKASTHEKSNKLKITEDRANFLFGRFFLPRTLLLGDHIAVSGFDLVLIKPEYEKKEDGANFILNITIDGNIYNINYFIPSKIESRANLSRMLKSLVKAVLPMWRKYFKIQKIGGSLAFSGTSPVECLLLGGIKYKNSLIPVEIGLPQGILDLFTAELVEPGMNISENSVRLILVNQSLQHIFLNKNLFLPLSLSEFLNLIDKIDLKKIIQNFFPGKGWKIDVIQSLFYYSKKDSQKNKIYYFQDPHFDRESFFDYLPKSQKEEWGQSRSVSDSFDEMISSGRNALRDIYHSYCKDHLELSYKASSLLNYEFKVRGDKKIRVELDRAIDKKSFSILLEDTFPRDVQNLLAKLTVKVIANAVVLYTESLVSLEPFMSRNYKTELRDLIKIIQRSSIKDGFNMEEIRVDFYELYNGLNNLSKEELI